MLAAALSAGCLRKEVTHVLYIDPTGTTWSVVERNVRSDEENPISRFTEEHDYLLAARAGIHPVARALGAIGATPVTTSIVRADRPFTVMTEGRAADLASLARALLAHAGVSGGAGITHDGCRVTFRAWADAEQSGDDATDVADLIAEPGAYRFVLTEGRFVAATGFTIVEDGSIAVPLDEVAVENGRAAVSLVWTDGSCLGDDR